MSTDHDGRSPSAQNVSSTVGTVISYRYDTRSEAWSWSPPDHGLPEAVLARLLAAAAASGERFGFVHTIDLPDGGARHVTVVGEAPADGGGSEVSGYVLDLSDVLRGWGKQQADEAVAAALATRGVIDQAKGVLMLAHGIDDEAAITLLRWWSSRSNVKLNELARRMVRALEDGRLSSAALRRTLTDLMEESTRTAR